MQTVFFFCPHSYGNHLIVVARTQMNNGYCYICYNIERNCLVRPIYNIRQSFWIPVYHFYLGTVLCMKPHPFWSDPTPPHGNNDMLVEPFLGINFCGFELPFRVFWILWYLSASKFADIFGHHIGSKFVPEGTNCHSVGVLRVQSKELSLYRTQEGKRRLLCWDEDRTRLDLPLTAVVDPFIHDCLPDEYVLVLIGLGRPYAGNCEYQLALVIKYH